MANFDRRFTAFLYPTQRFRAFGQLRYAIGTSFANKLDSPPRSPEPFIHFTLEYSMLVLSRKPNQSIRIGNEITIKIVRVKGNTIQLGIEAPKEIPVVRSELLDKEAQGKAPSEKENSQQQSTKPAQSKDSGPSDSEAEADKRPPLSLFIAANGDSYGTAI